MIKYASYLLPYLLKAPRRNPVKQLAGLLLAYALVAIAMIFLFIAVFVWTSKTYGTEMAFAGVGAALLLSGVAMLFWINRPKEVATPLPPRLAQDPLAQYVPDSMRSNPTIQKLLYQIGESPITATATAVTVGMLLSKEIFEDTK